MNEFRQHTHKSRHEHMQYALPAAPRAAVEEMITIIGDLQDIYTRETDALKSSDTNGFLDLQENKVIIARRYENGIAQILGRKEEIKLVDQSLKNKLTRMQEKFSRLAHENKDALKRMQRTTERLGETIRHAAKDAIQNRVATSYSAQGALNKGGQKGSVSVGIQETA